MTEAGLTFECDLDSSDIINPDDVTEVVSSRTYLGGALRARTKHRLFNEPQLKKYFIPVDFRAYGLMLYSFIDPDTFIPEHDHDEAVFRYILDGELELNDMPFSKGDWLIVPKFYKYSIKTITGYSVLSGYHANCAECQWKSLSKLPLGHASDAP